MFLARAGPFVLNANVSSGHPPKCFFQVGPHLPGASSASARPLGARLIHVLHDQSLLGALFPKWKVPMESLCRWISGEGGWTIGGALGGGAASPSLPREQQKAQERQELWQGLEELRLRRLQGTQGAKEAPLQRLTPPVAASGGQS